MRSLSFLALLALAPGLLAQQNRVQGLDGNLFLVSRLTYQGHRGSAFPNGESAFAMQNDMCNLGTVNIPWQAAMQPDHPKFGFMLCREADGRFVQVSDRSHVKHAFLSINSSSFCGTCVNPGTNALMGVHCSDTYDVVNNNDRYYLGPADELDPWLGTWNPVGSYFDRGDPDVGFPANQDGNRSLTRTQANAMDAVRNRVIVKDADLSVPGTYYYCIHLLHQGEPVENRTNNLASRPFTASWGGSSWSVNWNIQNQQQGTWLQWWSGATYDLAGNGLDDGRFAVGVKVSGPTNGLWHYEYAVHNIDNSRGGATFRVPLCSSARVFAAGFKDIDGDPLDDWSSSVQGGELVFAAPANNPLNWNEIFNFWFDSDAAPVTGQVHLDEARLGAGALDVAVNSTVPMSTPNVWLGAGCGAPAPELRGNGIASSPSAAYALDLTGAPNSFTLLLYSWLDAQVPLPGGCTQFLDGSLMGTFGSGVTNAQGDLHLLLPIPAGLPPTPLAFQAAQLQPGGPLLSMLALSNGLLVRVGMNGCR